MASFRFALFISLPLSIMMLSSLPTSILPLPLPLTVPLPLTHIHTDADTDTLPLPPTLAELDHLATPPSTSFPPLFSSLTDRPVLLALGDSLTQRGFAPQGFLTLLSHYYQRRLDVINRGFSGFNSDWLKQWLTNAARHKIWPFDIDNDVLAVEERRRRRKALILLWIGTNDSVLKGEKQFVPIERFVTNLFTLIQRLHTLFSSDSTIILITPPTCDPLHWARFQQARDCTASPAITRSVEHTLKYVEAVREIASELKLPIVDAWNLTAQAQSFVSENPNLVDGLHLTALGNSNIFRGLLAVIEKELKSWTIDELLLDAPTHQELNEDNFKQLLSTTHGSTVDSGKNDL